MLLCLPNILDADESWSIFWEAPGIGEHLEHPLRWGIDVNRLVNGCHTDLLAMVLYYELFLILLPPTASLLWLAYPRHLIYLFEKALGIGEAIVDRTSTTGRIKHNSSWHSEYLVMLS